MKNENQTNQKSINLRNHFPIMIYWMDRGHVFRGSNLETCRITSEMLNPKHSLKLPMFNKYGEVIGLIAFQIPNNAFAKQSVNFFIGNESQNNINLQFVFENAPVAFWIMDKNGVFIDGNHQAFRAAGVNSLEEFNGKTMLDFAAMNGWALEEAQEFHNIIQQILQTGIEESHVETSEYYNNNEPTFMRQSAWALRPILNADCQVIAIAGASFFNDEQTQNKQFIIPENKIAGFLGQKQ